MRFETLRFETDGHVATVVLNRGSTGNLIDQGTASELGDVCDQLERNEDIRVAIVAGDGDCFCRGTFPKAMGDMRGTLRFLRVAERIVRVRKPVVAAITGDAIDQGLELALACDLRVASSQARLGLTQAKHGLVPWDGGTQRLPRLLGRGRAMEMLLTSRLVDATEALEMGLVSQVVEPDAVLPRAREVAAAIAGHGPIAARYLKEAVSKGLDMTLDQGLRLEADLNVILQSTSDRNEGIRSFLERRPPEYTGE